MALFTIADLHLSNGSDHAMDVFGPRWQSYTAKIEKNWRLTVSDSDTVVIPGDISWAMHLAEAREDFAFLDALPGRKLLSKGNHDFWWETAAKLNRFFDENGFRTFSLLYNNAHIVEDYIICGTRGWFLEEEQQQTVGKVDFSKMVNREVLRLQLSLQAAKKLQVGEHANKEILVFLHFPPVWNAFACNEILDVLRDFGVKRCYHGHIHGVYSRPATQELDCGLKLYNVASDFLNFMPLRILPI